MGQRVFEQAMDIWIRPEVASRKRDGTLTVPFELNAAQVIMPTPREKRLNYVRLNEQVRAKIRVKTAKAIEKGELVFNQDIQEVSAIRLMEDDEPNAGHLTALNIGGQWMLGIDFRRDKSHAKDLLRTAREFYGTAKLSFENGWLGPTVESLFASAELAAKAELLLLCFYPYKNPKDHGSLRGKYAKWANLGNAPLDGNTALNKLSRLRSAGRYGEGVLNTVPWSDLFEAVNKMMSHSEERLGAHLASTG